MKIYFAPMEGITSYIFRNAFNEIYGHIDKFFAPFISPSEKCPMTPRERKDITPENNKGVNLVPQILTCRSDCFIEAAKELQAMGYKEVNLNLGCPSGTVTAKGRGAGFLLFPEKLNDFFDQVFDALGDDAKLISIKTRIGYSDASEMEKLSEIYNKYPFKQLIIHPRVREDFYNGIPNLDAFEKAMDTATAPVIYNGNIFRRRYESRYKNANSNKNS